MPVETVEHRMHRPSRRVGLLLACVMLLAQAFLPVHATEHLDHQEEDACSICVISAPLHAAVGGSTPVLVSPASSHQQWSLAPYPAPIPNPSLTPHSARAPPERDAL